MEDKHCPHHNGDSCLVEGTDQRYKGLESTGKGQKFVKGHELVGHVTNQKEGVLTKVL